MNKENKMTHEAKIKSLIGCLTDYGYTADYDWDTFNELIAKATAYDNAKEDLELAQAARELFAEPNKKGIEVFITRVRVRSTLELLNWRREQKEREKTCL